MAGVIVQDIAACINTNGGFALFADYGHDGVKEDTFRVSQQLIVVCLWLRL